MVTPEARRLKTLDPALTQRYQQQTKSELNSLALFGAMKKLLREARNNGWSPTLEAEYNRISAANVQARRLIETKLRKLKMGLVPWSPKLQAFRTAIEFWKLLWRKRSGKKTSWRKIRQLLRSSSTFDGALKLDLLEVRVKLAEAHAAYKEAKKHAFNWRDDFMHTIAEN